MKPIRITEANKEAIEAALKEVNGAAKQHAYTGYPEVAFVLRYAEKKLASILPKKSRRGAKWTETSGAEVSNAYSKKAFEPRPATSITLEHRASGWFLVGVYKTHVYQDGGGAGRLHITQQHADEAIARFASSFTVENAK